MTTNNHLKRSNAIRLKTLDSKLSRELYKSKLTNLRGEPNSNNIVLLKEKQVNSTVNLLNEIKEGVRLHPINRNDKRKIIKEISYDNDKMEYSNKNEPALFDLLALALNKRQLVMQLTDDESELSSIDSQQDLKINNNIETKYEQNICNENVLDEEASKKDDHNYYYYKLKQKENSLTSSMSSTLITNFINKDKVVTEIILRL